MREGAMTDDGIGRLLVASLHQSIGDVLPTRLEYYEHWLTPMGLREGRGGLAPLGAVLSFLRREGEPTYARVMRTAGEYSADWHHAEHGAGIRLRRWLPRRLRARIVLKRTRGLLQEAFRPLGVTTSMRRGGGTVEITQSVFCTLREPWPWPTCAYFAGAVERSLALHGLDADVHIASCQTQEGGACRLDVGFSATRRPEPPTP